MLAVNSPEFTVLACHEQFNGRGQGENSWESEGNKNLTFSVLLFPNFLKASQSFYLNMAICLGVSSCLSSKTNLKIDIKWPNDLFINEKKVGGILMENSIRAENMNASIVGIGINVNQTNFTNKLNATSLINETKEDFELDSLIKEIVFCINLYYIKLKKGDFNFISSEFKSRLLGIDEERNFLEKDEKFVGKIKGVDEFGRLLVEKEGEVLTFQHKTIKYLFE